MYISLNQWGDGAQPKSKVQTLLLNSLKSDEGVVWWWPGRSGKLFGEEMKSNSAELNRILNRFFQSCFSLTFPDNSTGICKRRGSPNIIIIKLFIDSWQEHHTGKVLAGEQPFLFHSILVLDLDTRSRLRQDWLSGTDIVQFTAPLQTRDGGLACLNAPSRWKSSRKWKTSRGGRTVLCNELVFTSKEHKEAYFPTLCKR